jgi:hypothetical protein
MGQYTLVYGVSFETWQYSNKDWISAQAVGLIALGVKRKKWDDQIDYSLFNQAELNAIFVNQSLFRT